MTLGSTQAVMAAVDQNLGIGFVTKHAVENHDRVVALRIEGLSLERDLNLIYESARVRGRHTRRSSTPS
jgi:DNA-binding transcriptional LysR family regulator